MEKPHSQAIHTQIISPSYNAYSSDKETNEHTLCKYAKTWKDHGEGAILKLLKVPELKNESVS